LIEKPTTIKELCEFIWYLEEKYDLLDFEIDGIKVWQYTRMHLYYKLAEASGILSPAHTKLSMSDKIKHSLGYMKNSLIDNYFTLQQKEAVVLSHARVVKVDGELIDIYTKYFIDELFQKSKEIVEFERPHLGAHQKRKTDYTHYTDWITLFQKITSLFSSVELTNEQEQYIHQVQNEINVICGTYLDMRKFVIDKIKIYKATFAIYNKIFQKVKPKVFYVVVSYGIAPIIKAAKENGIEVIELQHGTFSKYHLGYSFPGRTKPLEYFPDKFYVWSVFWKNIIKLPLSDNNVVVDRFRYLEKQKSKFAHLEKKEKQLIVLSQGAIGNDIAKKFLEHFDRFKDYKIKYKLHPGEFDRWQEYPALKKLSHFENVDIIKNEVPLYELFATSSLQVGVFSTALYEGVEFGCKTILLNVNGIEYMKRFSELAKDVEYLD
jgi:hypothetical protein